MTPFHYGLGFIAVALVIAAIKAEHNMRVVAVLALVAVMIFSATRKKR